MAIITVYIVHSERAIATIILLPRSKQKPGYMDMDRN